MPAGGCRGAQEITQTIGGERGIALRSRCEKIVPTPNKTVVKQKCCAGIVLYGSCRHSWEYGPSGRRPRIFWSTGDHVPCLGPPENKQLASACPRRVGKRSLLGRMNEDGPDRGKAGCTSPPRMPKTNWTLSSGWSAGREPRRPPRRTPGPLRRREPLPLRH